MLNCFDGYFALSSLNGETVTDGGSFLTSHEHITQELARACTDPEFPDGIAFFDKAYAAAKREFMNDFNINVGQFFDRTIAVDGAQVGVAKEPKELDTDVSGNIGGILISTIQSKWISLYVDHIKVYHVAGGNAETIYIYDATTGDTLHTAEYDSVAGWQTIQIQKSFVVSGQTKYFIIGIANVFGDTIVTNITGGWWNSCGCTDTYGRLFSVKGGTIESISEKTKENWTQDTNTHGLIVKFSLLCSREQIIQNNAELFRPVFFQKLVIEFLKLVGASPKINESTLNYDSERVNAIIYGESGGKFASSVSVPGLNKKYESNMTAICEGIQKETGDGICFDCAAPVKMITSLP